MKLYYDLHIHSTLSPCGDELMTVNNILNMSIIKGLDLIAVTDHNSAKNIEALLLASMDTDLLVIPGMEVESYEGIHYLCFFRDLESLKAFDQIIYSHLPDVPNNEELLGKQILLNQFDEEIGVENKLLLNSTMLRTEDLVTSVHQFQGLIIPAHVDKYANSIQTILGFIPENLLIDGIEVNSPHYPVQLKRKVPVIHNSDAHFLGDICEKTNYIDIKQKSVDAFFEYFGR